MAHGSRRSDETPRPAALPQAAGEATQAATETESSPLAAARPGCLWIVATPIGHLADFSVRAVDTLKRMALILCEDTRTSRVLLRHYGIDRPLQALHEHNERDTVQRLIERLRGGDELALISDAGTPLVSDPGFALVRAAREAQVEVRAVPGACALIAALSIAGLPSDRFVFEGFLPAADKARNDRLLALAGEARTLLFYEAPHRLLDFLKSAVAAFGPMREASIARELSKRFESLYRDTLGALLALAERDSDLSRGELVIVIAGAPESGPDLSEARRIHRILAAELPPSQAAKLAAKLTGRHRKEFYGKDEAED